MKTFEFKAGTTKDEAVLGLSAIASFMLTTLIILLIVELLMPRNNVTHAATKNPRLEGLLVAPGFIISYFVMKKIKRKAGHRFKVNVIDGDTTIYIDDEEKHLGHVDEVIIKDKPQMVTVILYGSEDSFTLVGRYKGNPFGFCDIEDLEELKAFAMYLQSDVVTLPGIHN